MDIYTTIDSPVGEILLAGDGTALTRVSFDRSAVRAGWRREPLAFAAAERQLGEYFAGERTSFDLPLSPRGTAFQERVWAEVATIPYGTTTTYGALAARVGAPADRIRAVGAAVGANPLLVVLPCHRVIAANGALTGYAGGLERKHALLTLEGALQPQLWSVLS
ncbi:methylated-DNA--[protein]-cysteine S-methyltransferase [Nonomuraea sp. NPDC049709]|uniref:methylated-DNA--[protein]-cysteine S-methyltransferase n=1 Tax=Nonomuraea sp. NPDC049709 TaxID=3154736 RepID=UPI0034399B7D